MLLILSLPLNIDIFFFLMILETDFVGNYVGSSYAWATTRDWAKFGLLYLNNGNWKNDYK